MNIENTVALVTGANRGIGAALVEALLERGASKVYAAARREGDLGTIRSKADGAGGEVVSRGRPQETVVGDADARPDLVAVMRSPDAATIRGFLDSHAYRARETHRNEAFEDIRSYIADDLMTQTEETA